MTTRKPTKAAKGGKPRKPYDSPMRRQAMEETRERIVAAGVEIVRGYKTSNWDDLTFRAVAEHAGVSERTVYRHFPTERILHSAVMGELAKEAGVDYEAVTLATIANVSRRVFRALGSLDLQTAADPLQDAAFTEQDRQRRDALLRAVASARPEWPKSQQVRLAAALDVLWSVSSFERLIDQWELQPKKAMDVIAWTIDTIIESSSANGERRPPH
jgi:AcrR family transcriptional regulator